MMKNINSDDQIIKDYFKSKQVEIPDNGFTDKVMHHITSSERKLKMARLFISCMMVAIGVVTLLLITESTPALLSILGKATEMSMNLNIPSFSPDYLQALLMQQSSIALIIVVIMGIIGYFRYE